MKKWIIRILLILAVVVPLILWTKVFLISFVAVILASYLVYLWLKWKFWRIAGPLKDIGGAFFAETMKLEKQESLDLYKSEEVASIEEQLGESGFHLVGRYTAKEIPDMNLIFLAHSEAAIYALIMDSEYLDVITEFIAPYSDETSFTYSNTEIEEALEKPPCHTLKRFPKKNPIELLAEFKEARPEGDRRKLNDAELITFVEDMFREEKVWQKEYYEGEEATEKQLTEAFLEKMGWSAIEWNEKQDDVIFVHEKLKNYDVIDLFMGMLEIDEAEYDKIEKEVEKIARKTPPIEAVKIMVEQFGGEKIEKLISLEEPLKADVYYSESSDADEY